MRVMVVDDSDIALAVISNALELDGHQVVTRLEPFGTGAAVLRERPHVLVLDVNMPFVDGVQVAQVIQNDMSISKVHVVLHSDRPESELEALAAAAGASAFVPKSSDMRRLRRVVNELGPATRRVTRRAARVEPDPDGPVLFVDDARSQEAYARAFGRTLPCCFETSAEGALFRIHELPIPSLVVCEISSDGVDGAWLFDQAQRLHTAWRTHFLFVALKPWLPAVTSLVDDTGVPMLPKPIHFRALRDLIDQARAPSGALIASG